MNVKKLLSIVTAAAMLAPVMPVTGRIASAADIDTTTTSDFSFTEETGEITFTEYNDKENGQYKVVGKNRRGAHTDAATPYTDEETALNSAVNYTKEKSGRIKLLLAYDSSVSTSASGNDYYVVNSTGGTKTTAQSTDQLPYLILTKSGGSATNVPTTEPTEAPTETPSDDKVWEEYSDGTFAGTYPVTDTDTRADEESG